MKQKWHQNQRFNIVSISVFAYWYVSLFPGRLGFDYSLAIRMIQNGQSTDWWTSSFFWFLRITSFWGREIFLSSFITYFALFLSLRYLIFSLPADQRILKKTFIIATIFPLVSVFGLTVSHDVFQVSGIFLLTGMEFRRYRAVMSNTKTTYITTLLAYVMLTTTQTGVVVILLDVILQIMRRKFLVQIICIILTAGVYCLSTIDIAKHDPSGNVAWMVADLKCIAQHPEARISDSEWKFLVSLAPKSDWLLEMSCTTVDEPVGAMKSLNRKLMRLNLNFVSNYTKIVIKNPSIAGVAHIQRSRGALPPPFFQGPDNQVELNTSIPIGKGTNVALQNSFEILHPSIDEPTVDRQVSFLKPFELIAQGLMFFFNQASWFWGWGALWMYPALYFTVTRIRNSTFIKRTQPLYFVFLLHVMLVAVGPGPLPRYVMSAIILGLSTTIILFLEWAQKYRSEIDA